MAETILALQVPGPAGPAGTNGTNGTNGQPAFTQAVASFAIPNVLDQVTVEVLNSDWMVDHQKIFVLFGGSGFEVAFKPDSAHVTLINNGGSDNAAPGTVIPANAFIGCSGVPGATGATGGSGLVGVGVSKGDILVFNGTTWNRLSVGANGTRLTADSAQSLGVKWA